MVFNEEILVGDNFKVKVRLMKEKKWDNLKMESKVD